MYKVGEYIIYGTDGVCRVEEITSAPFLAPKKDSLYYRLQPVFDKGTICVPVDATVPMRAVSTPEEITALFSRLPAMRATLASGTPILPQDMPPAESLEGLLYTALRAQKRAEFLAQKHKVISEYDKRLLSRAERALHGELAIALNIPFEETTNYISNVLSK